MRVLLTIDESKYSEAAVEAVLAQCRPRGTEVRVLHVLEMTASSGYPVPESHDQRIRAKMLVDRAAKKLKASGFKAGTMVVVGGTRAGIVDSAMEWHADLVFLGSHGHTDLGRFLMGSVSDAVLHHAHCSVELVRIPRVTQGSKRIGGPAKGKTTRILLATDDSRFSEAASRMLIMQARRHETEVRILCVVEPPSLLVAREMGGYDPAMETVCDAQTSAARALVAKTAEILRAKGLNVSTAVEQGNAKSKILDAAEEWHADLIMLGSHGRSGLERFLMGSVSDAVARHARCSVEVVRIRP